MKANIKKDFECPGSKSIKEPVPEIFTCSNCGAEVEIWTNEMRRKCSSCGEMVIRELDSEWCVQWCEYAQECVGAEKYSELVKEGIISEEKKEVEVQIPGRLKQFMKENKVPIPGEN